MAPAMGPVAGVVAAGSCMWVASAFAPARQPSKVQQQSSDAAVFAQAQLAQEPIAEAPIQVAVQGAGLALGLAAAASSLFAKRRARWQATPAVVARRTYFEVIDVEPEEPPQPPPPNHPEPIDVLIVGAGASGIGVALMLTQTFGLDPQRVVLVERGEGVGESFKRWPREMRFISPSFNNQGWTGSFDLNSVAHGTSPAFTLGTEHPTGENYAFYLSALAEVGELNVRARTEVTAVRPERGGFCVDIAPAIKGGVAAEVAEVGLTTLRSRYVIWAAGEFQYPGPSKTSFPGSELCFHNSSVRRWAELPGDDFVVIGGYESGIDAASNLASCGKRCTVVSSTAYWRVATDDPSTELAPFTADRLRKACSTPTPPRLLAPLRVCKVERLGASGGGGGEHLVRARWGPPVEHLGGTLRLALPALASADGVDEKGEEGTEISLRTPQPPILCTGFEGSVALGVAKDLFEFGSGQGCAAGAPLLTAFDESTKTPGLFLVGPAVRHGQLSFCFVYKFRKRFGIVADAIARGLGRSTADAVGHLRRTDMFLDGLDGCKGADGEACC